jgi:hypothetical protein
MECGIVTTFGKLFFSEFLFPCARLLWGTRAVVRDLRARVETLTEECLEWKRKYEAARKQLGEVKFFATAGLVPYMIYHPSGTPLYVALAMLCLIHRSTLVDLAALLGSQPLSMASDLNKYVRQGLRLSGSLWQSARSQMRLVSHHLMQFAVRIHRRVRKWQWKPINVFRSLGATH